jgi:prepilin-type N-terminal cleavage/methylation domain-containing protein
MKSMRTNQSAFTLVELLIVIALIAILSVAVLATINPIEQTNKARDAKFKNDAAEVLGSFERYYASQTAYPWNSAPTYVANVSFAVGSTSQFFGVLDAGTSAGGVLIATSELKSSFAGKEAFQNNSTGTVRTAIADMMIAYNNGRDSNYVCFFPKATANKSNIVAAQLKCFTGPWGTGAVLSNIGVNGCNTVPAGQTVGISASGIGNTANLLCVPEGDVQ